MTTASLRMAKIVTEGIRSGRVRNERKLLGVIEKSRKGYGTKSPLDALPARVYMEAREATIERHKKLVPTAAVLMSAETLLRALNEKDMDVSRVLGILRVLAGDIVLKDGSVNLLKGISEPGLLLVPGKKDFEKIRKLVDTADKSPDKALLIQFYAAMADINEARESGNMAHLWLLAGNANYIGVPGKAEECFEWTLETAIKPNITVETYEHLIRYALKLDKGSYAYRMADYVVSIEK